MAVSTLRQGSQPPGRTTGGELDCSALESSRNHAPDPGLWKNALLQNESLVPERVGSAALRAVEDGTRDS